MNVKLLVAARTRGEAEDAARRCGVTHPRHWLWLGTVANVRSLGGDAGWRVLYLPGWDAAWSAEDAAQVTRYLRTACVQTVTEAETRALTAPERRPVDAEPRPLVGDHVHYVSYGTPGGEYRSTCRAAVVTEVGGGYDHSGDVSVGLAVLNPAGLFFRSLADGGSQYHAGDVGHEYDGSEILTRSYRGGSWHWPERAPDEGDAS